MLPSSCDSDIQYKTGNAICTTNRKTYQEIKKVSRKLHVSHKKKSFPFLVFSELYRNDNKNSENLLCIAIITIKFMICICIIHTLTVLLYSVRCIEISVQLWPSFWQFTPCNAWMQLENSSVSWGMSDCQLTEACTHICTYIHGI